jgi:hypothetical protein
MLLYGIHAGLRRFANELRGYGLAIASILAQANLADHLSINHCLRYETIFVKRAAFPCH